MFYLIQIRMRFQIEIAKKLSYFALMLSFLEECITIGNKDLCLFQKISQFIKYELWRDEEISKYTFCFAH